MKTTTFYLVTTPTLSLLLHLSETFREYVNCVTSIDEFKVRPDPTFTTMSRALQPLGQNNQVFSIPQAGGMVSYTFYTDKLRNLVA